VPPLDEIKPYLAKKQEWVERRKPWIAEWNKVFGYRP